MVSWEKEKTETKGPRGERQIEHEMRREGNEGVRGGRLNDVVCSILNCSGQIFFISGFHVGSQRFPGPFGKEHCHTLFPGRLHWHGCWINLSMVFKPLRAFLFLKVLSVTEVIVSEQKGADESKILNQNKTSPSSLLPPLPVSPFHAPVIDRHDDSGITEEMP